MRMRYWLRLLGMMLAMALITSAVMSFLNLFTRDTGGDALRDGLRMMACYLLYMGCLIQVIYMLTIFKIYVPIAICFGCTRREALAGVQLIKFGTAFGVLLSAGVIALGVGQSFFQTGLYLLPALLGALLGLGSLGGILGAVFQFFGRRGVFVTIGLCALFGALAGGLMAVGFSGRELMRISQLVNLCAGGAGALLCIVDLLLQRKLLASFAVRF